MNKENNVATKTSRIIVLDYLRVIAVGILFLYHLGMIWVPEWPYHFKQPTEWTWLQHFMILSSPWRMGLLWFISGASLYIMQKKWGFSFLLTNRSNAILLPLLFGILFVVPVQLFVEMTQKGAIDDGLADFFYHFYFGANSYFEGFSAGVWHHIDVNHLWFLRSLWRFTIVLAILQYPIAQLQARYGLFNLKWFAFLVILSIALLAIDNTDLERDIYGLFCLICGYLFGAKQQFWDWLNKRIVPMGITAITLIIIYQLCFGSFHHKEDNQLPLYIAGMAYQISKVVALFAVLAIAQRVFTKPSSFVGKANPYVFPLYVVHQSVLITVAFLISELGVSSMFSMILTMLISLIICAAILLFCKYSALVGLLLGKRPAGASWFMTKPAQLWMTFITLPLVARLLGLV